MPSLIRLLCICGFCLLFLSNGPLLDFLGWNYTSTSGSALTKVHPAFYLLVPAALFGLLSDDRRFRALLSQPWFALYLIAAVALTLRAVLNTNGLPGQMTAAIVTFLLPAVLMIAVQAFNSQRWSQLAPAIRLFFALNSIMGLAERMIGSRFIPSFIEELRADARAAAFLGHPLNASLLTGLMLVYLASARPRHGEAVSARLPEMLLHLCAMFAFGGRSALVFTTATILASALWQRRARNEQRMSLLQRALPFAILAIGALVMFLPIPFIEATLARFEGDAASTQARNVALELIGVLTSQDIFYGLTAARRDVLLEYYSIPAIEISWIAIMLTFGLIPAILIGAGLIALLAGVARRLDRSASWMALLLLVVTVGSLSIGSKSLLISQTLVMMQALSQRRMVDKPGGVPPNQQLPLQRARGSARPRHRR